MAHLVHQMAYVNNPPWHGIGNRLSEKQPIEVWASQAGMDWHILEAPVEFRSEGRRNVSAAIEFPEKKVLYRSDTNVPLSVVSNRYNVVQPREILEFYRDLTEVAGFELETAGVLKGGRKCWALARTNQSTSLKGNDEMRGYLLLATACDGTLATVAKFTSVRVVCNNTLEVATRLGGGVKVPHSTSFNAQAVKNELGVALSSWDDFMYQMKQLSQRKVNGSEAEKFIRRLFDVGDSFDYAPTNAKAMQLVQELFEGRGRGAELASAKGTAFGLLNSVTEFIDHERRARSVDFRIDSAWFGQGATLKAKALDLAIGLI
nr:DUF932 domain-containing protein [Herbaspirillum sp. ASV7]